VQVNFKYGQDSDTDQRRRGGAVIRRILMTAFRLLVTAGLLWVLTSRLDLARAENIAGHVSLPILAAALVALLGTLPATAVRWHVILAAAGPSPGFGSLTKLLFVGAFFNQVLPTGIGGDAVRAWRCRRLGVALGAAVRSVLLDRASGYLVIVALYAASLPTLLRIFPDVQERLGIVTVFAGALFGLFVLPLMDYLPTRLLRSPVLATLAELSRETRRLVVHPGRCGAVLGLSVLTVGFAVLGYMLVGDSLSISLSFATWLLVVPPVTLIQLLPISLAGWGVREAGMVVILAGLGVPAEAALAISVLTGLGLVVIGLPGGLIWLTDWDVARPRPRTADGLARPGLVE
jgi:uncharacterized membrane protein YbhN (UPF0104 family)